MSIRIIVGDALERLRELPDGSVRCCVTSPPYWWLRDYGVAGQLGLEATPEEYVAKLVAVFQEVRRVLAGDGTLWLNLGDSYVASPNGNGDDPSTSSLTNPDRQAKVRIKDAASKQASNRSADIDAPHRRSGVGLRAKNLIGIPWRVAFALQADGWYLRSDIIWAKPNPMPESVTDRPTKAHEYVFLLSKAARYYYDADAVAEPLASDPDSWGRHSKKDPGAQAVTARPMFGPERNGRDGTEFGNGKTRNTRSVWTIATSPYPEAHFATFPPELPRRCILAGSANGDTILDPFGGAGTTGLVADRLGRHAILIELNPKYAAMAEQRIRSDAPLFHEPADASR